LDFEIDDDGDAVSQEPMSQPMDFEIDDDEDAVSQERTSQSMDFGIDDDEDAVSQEPTSQSMYFGIDDDDDDDLLDIFDTPATASFPASTDVSREARPSSSFTMTDRGTKRSTLPGSNRSTLPASTDVSGGTRHSFTTTDRGSKRSAFHTSVDVSGGTRHSFTTTARGSKRSTLPESTDDSRVASRSFTPTARGSKRSTLSESTDIPKNAISTSALGNTKRNRIENFTNPLKNMERHTRYTQKQHVMKSAAEYAECQKMLADIKTGIKKIRAVYSAIWKENNDAQKILLSAITFPNEKHLRKRLQRCSIKLRSKNIMLAIQLVATFLRRSANIGSRKKRLPIQTHITTYHFGHKRNLPRDGELVDRTEGRR
jgi:hypothetical protein